MQSRTVELAILDVPAGGCITAVIQVVVVVVVN